MSGTSRQAKALEVNSKEIGRADASGKPLVMHVVEALGGGVMTALVDYLNATEGEFRHVVVANLRDGHDTGDFCKFRFHRLGPVYRPATLRRLFNLWEGLQADIVHAHSSWAGLAVRLLPISSARIAYTPHCYAFERRDVSIATRVAFFSAEALLSRRSCFVLAVSPRELSLARRLPWTRRAFYVPNAVPNRQRQLRKDKASSRICVVGSGRIMAQKGPEWFSEFVIAARELGFEGEFRWLGGGPVESEQRMRALGIQVSGWLDRDTLLRQLEAADLYVHSASWEGAPLSVLEAAASRVAILGRDIPALRSLDVGVLRESPVDAARWLVENGRRNFLESLGVSQARDIEIRHSREVQRNAITEAYAAMLESQSFENVGAKRQDLHTGEQRAQLTVTGAAKS